MGTLVLDRSCGKAHDVYMTKRAIALAEAKVCGYNGDTGKFWIRLLVESRVNRALLNEAWAIGAAVKAAE